MPTPKKTRTSPASKKSAAVRGEPGRKEAFQTPPAIVIEGVIPEIDGGLFPVKTVSGEAVRVEADIFKDGHDVLAAALLYKKRGDKTWQEVPMRFLLNDRWEASFAPKENSRFFYTIEAWMDPVQTWIRNTAKKCAADQNVQTDVEEGLAVLGKVLQQADPSDQKALETFLKNLEMACGAPEEVNAVLQDAAFLRLAAKHPVKVLRTQYEKTLELIVDRRRAQFAAWYEMFPRSQGRVPGKSGTFKDCALRLPDIKRMGFDVVYLPPIHPIGFTKRKGPNNSLNPLPDSPGSCWAIGSKFGGHKSVHPDLGTLEDFENFVDTAADYGIEIALDLAYQCSPDHPYVKEHPEWFFHRPDGTIHYAENPPKKYEDIFPINFYCANHEALWEELRSIVIFWIRKGVRTFRVDNPHTKPLRFWKWLIDSVQKDFPDVIFLSEAFTRPKVMKFLAKAGFTQSYTYFTWRNAKWELKEYLRELTQTEMKDYFRGNFFANTPDILHAYLQTGGRPAFKVRQVLAATLSSVYGIYSGFELCENRVKEPGTEDYLNSEKYEHKVWDWERAGNIKDFIARVNRIRNENAALQGYANLEFYDSNNENILCYGKRSPDDSNIIVVVVNLDPFHVQEDTVTLPIQKFGLENWMTYQMKDLLTGNKYYWKGPSNFVRLDPQREPAHVFELKK